MNVKPVRPVDAACGAGFGQGHMLLLVGAVEDDSDGRTSHFAQFPWHTQRAQGCREARPLIRRNLPRVIVSERDLPDGDWKDILGLAAARKDPPVVIVTSRLADESLWSEVLNLGGYDVLAKPLDRSEVQRTIKLAWQHWANRGDSRMYRTCETGK
jgi:DNA-binding response OmpR family regulator